MLSLSRQGDKDSLASEARSFLKEKIKGTIDDVTEDVVKDFEKFDCLEERELEIVEELEMDSIRLRTWVEEIYKKIKEQADWLMATVYLLLQ